MNRSKLSIKTIFSAVTCFLIITGGVAGMSQMAKANKGSEAQKQPPIKQVSVDTIPVVKEDIAVCVTGYGQINPVVLNEISSEVSGKIIKKTSLKQGETVQKGEILFKIDSTDYETALEKALIQLKLKENQIEQLTVSYDQDKSRLIVAKQNTRLAKSNFSRLSTLYTKNRVGTLSGVEEAEQSYNSLLDTEKTLAKSVALYPLQIAEAQSSLADASSDLKKARLDVERCTISAPFTGRIKELSIETGSHISTGTKVVTLADDTILEVQVPLSDKDAFEVLGLRGVEQTTDLNSTSKDLECRVETITGNVSASLPASIHRVVKYDSSTRTLTLAVRVLQKHPSQSITSITIMDGMFCKIAFKGEPIKSAVKIPSDSLNSDNTVFLVRNNKLKTLRVTKVMEENGQTYVSGSFKPEDQIITTKLTSPIENTRIEQNQADNKLIGNSNPKELPAVSIDLPSESASSDISSSGIAASTGENR